MLSLTMGCLHPRLGITRRSMLRVPVKQHTGATPVCIICWIYLAALRLNRSESRFDLRPATSIASGTSYKRNASMHCLLDRSRCTSFESQWISV